MPGSGRDISSKADALAAKGKHKKALSLYLRLGDHHTAAEMCEKLGELEQAADEFAKAGELTRSAEILVDMGRETQAAKMFEKGKAYEDAAALYEKSEMFADAARMFQRGGNRDEAIRLYIASDKMDLAARLCAEGGNHAQAAEIYEQLEAYREAGDLYVAADRKREAIEAYDKAKAIREAAALCEELGLQERAADYHKQLGDVEHAAELYREAGQFSEAGKVLEDSHMLYDAARMYEQDKETVAHAGELFRRTYATEPCWQFEARSPVSDIALAPASGRVALSLAESEIFLFNNDGQTQWRFKIPMGVRTRSVSTTADGSLVAIGTKGRSVYLLDSAKHFLWKREFDGEVRGVSIEQEQGLIIAGCTDGRVRALTRDGKDQWTFEAAYKVWHLTTHAERGEVLVACGDMNLYLLDFKGELLWKEDTGDWVSRVDISADGRYAAAVIGLDLVTLYDLEKRTLLWQYQHPKVVHDVALLSDDRMLIGCNAGAFMLDFDQRCLWQHATDDRVMRVAATDDGSTVYLGHFEEGLVVSRLSDCMVRAARNFERAKMFAEAAAIYESKKELAPAIDLYVRVEDYAKAAPLAEEVGNLEDAANFYEKAGQLEEAGARFEQLGLIERAASCYTAAGDKSKAGQLLAQLGDAMKAAELHMQAGDFVAAGRLLEEEGASEAAQSAYEKAVEAGSLNADGAVRLARLYLSTERISEAIKLLQPVTEDADFGRQAVVLLAECFVGNGMYDLAVDRYRKALGGDEKVTTDNIDVFYGLGCAYERAGQYTSAREIFQDILATDYYYKDVTSRLEHVKEMSSIFPSAAPSAAGATIRADSDRPVTPVPQKTRYEIVSKLGEGGMGVVYLARDTKLNRTVAWKVLPSRLSNNDEFRSRFVREARAVAALNHRNIVALYDIGEERGESFISMEYIDGGSLRSILQTRKKLPLKEAMDIAKQVAEGLGATHKAGIIHRDIKPDNIMITFDDNQVKIMDFGLARIEEESKVTREGAVMGTLWYMSPEQVRGRDVGPATDVYATGMMIYEMLAGKPPFTEGDIAYHHVNTTAPRLSDVVPEVPDKLSAVIDKCLEKTVDNRYQDGGELRQALEFLDSTIDKTIVG